MSRIHSQSPFPLRHHREKPPRRFTVKQDIIIAQPTMELSVTFLSSTAGRESLSLKLHHRANLLMFSLSIFIFYSSNDVRLGNKLDLCALTASRADADDEKNFVIHQRN